MRENPMTNIVLCCDGTWNNADQKEVDGELCVTNVLKIACRLKKQAAGGALQTIYYDQGVGTGNVLDRIQGGATGEGLEANINDAYRFLLANYEPGDAIYIFGFSRGAYTARSIAGMIRRCGILLRENVKKYPQAKDLYRSGVMADDAVAVKFRKDFCIEVDTPIRCVGVWDTVGALGIPLRAFASSNQKKYQFLDTSLSRTVKFAFHALAVDEHRGPFEPTLWNSEPVAGQTVQQVWFAGAHSDVGGGYPEHGLSDLALNWMMDAASTAGLEFDAPVVTALGTKPDYKQKVHDSKSALYTFSGIDREIGKFKTEYFHRSVIEKWRDDAAYRPKPLQRHEAKLNALAGAGLPQAIVSVA
jgi:uncharacterized protein (DUF2235 family)